MGRRNLTKPAKTAKVTNGRFMNYCRTVDKAEISKLVRGMPGRMQDIIDAKGGPTRH